MQTFFGSLSGALVDFIVYSAIVLTLVTGLVKCIIPMRRLTGLFRKATRALEMMTLKEGLRPVWQDPLFLGKPMQKPWKRFLVNAEQLDARGLSLNAEDYINDETVFMDYAHMRVAEMVPGMLTSLGILGTFIGLMRGVSGLDVTSADSTMTSISQMIGGMTFAYGTSIAGLTGSLIFNILSRTTQGSATSALDSFHVAFRELAMQQPLDDSVHNICYMEDQAIFLRQAAGDMNAQLASGISVSIERAFTPIGQQINRFIRTEEQGQLEGLSRIVNQFVQQLDGAMNGQFRQLAHTLQGINQAQAVSFQSVDQAMAAADSLMQNMNQMNMLTAQVVERFDGYVNELAASQAGNAHLAEETSRIMMSLHAAVAQQREGFSFATEQQAALQEQMQQYASWSGRVLEAAEKQSDSVAAQAHEVANEMASSGKMLKDGYSSFVENISLGLARTMGMFEENMRDMMTEFSRQLLALQSAVKDSGATPAVSIEHAPKGLAQVKKDA